ncbi:MAG: FAD-dependent oxidoreductase [Betaproteobacteria bacterium]|nr:FAD-dependent oxidoreductase [Betaproteobacteria bacterium]MDE2124413.1 FAD-dependent oxidoreductase [Betaproteobacteria bacterium]MDE2186801.1 FAD-dependent oxidoreductase [Betaproteobacteria bacterium]MDE2325406.1 FAD-dependent oxidoreductase [Betaproteobacteria bacterium]
MRLRQILILALLGAALWAWFGLGLGRYFSLEALHQHLDMLNALRQTHPLAFAATYFVIYILMTSISVPGDIVLTLAGGALFGLIWGTVLVSFASSIGASLAFLSARFVLRDWVRTRLGVRIAAIDAGIVRDGPFYLFALRLVPAFPFFLINLAMGLTAMPLRTFYWVSQVGMLAGTLVFVNAGTQLAQIHALSDVASPGLLLSFTLLGLFPLVAKVVLARLRARRLYKPWSRPRRFDHNLVVIGGGAAGLVSAYIAAAAKARVALVEGGRMGGDCLNYGCVPSKALIHAARVAHQMRQAHRLGLGSCAPQVDFAAVMARVHAAVAEVAPHDSVERYTALGVDVLQGHARITSPWTVEVDSPEGRTVLSTRAIVIAAGAAPLVPPIPGLADIDYLTSDTLWDLRELPQRLLVLGGGPIGCELAQAFARLGSQVTLLEMLPRILQREDPDVAELVARSMTADGVCLRTAHKALRVERGQGRQWVLAEQNVGVQIEVEFDTLLCALGRAPRTSGYGLEELGLPLRHNRTVQVDATLQTLYPNIYACGDVAGPYQFTHTAAHQAWTASVNALLGGWWRFKSDLSVIPWTTFTDPEVAHVGLNESEAADNGVACEVTRYELAELDRAITEDATQGFVKVLTVPGKDKILGVTIVGQHAGELLAEFTLAMRRGLGLGAILGTVHAYPTWSEAAKATAGQWKRGHVSPRALALAQRFFTWRRGGSLS